MINGGRVPCRVREIVNRQYKAVFTPTQSITHTIEMRFNGEEVAGSPWHIPVEDRPERRHETNRYIVLVLFTGNYCFIRREQY
ncbi:hypothetical protein ANCCAN_26915 [Ancylostoma caninum]|uniref:Uncharacterized protein n=1 Tax=Ancylostoma caninum TaxID=29170 RepID=A0A368F5F4_ANCCA|nr:hypothetical protein ANCCAN_26915 [Ancylostoma caninum]